MATPDTQRFRIDQWDPAYGPSSEGGDSEARSVDVGVELALDDWRPLGPGDAAVSLAESVGRDIVMIDGVRRLDAGIWIDTDEGPTLALCASIAAGRIVLTDVAVIDDIRVRRVVASTEAISPIDTSVGRFEPVLARESTTESLSVAVQDAMARLETGLALDSDGTDRKLIVVDGPLRSAHLDPDVDRTILGYVKRHHTSYLPPPIMGKVMAMGAGHRSPLFGIGGRAARWSWYVSLDDDVGGIARVECDGRLDIERVVELADLSCGVLSRNASDPFRDARAPQNLYPIGAVERQARHRLGDPRLVRRALAEAAAG